MAVTGRVLPKGLGELKAGRFALFSGHVLPKPSPSLRQVQTAGSEIVELGGYGLRILDSSLSKPEAVYRRQNGYSKDTQSKHVGLVSVF